MIGIFSQQSRIAVGLEEGPDGACHVHCFSLPGCVATGRSVDEALEALVPLANRWLAFLSVVGEPVPPRSEELEIAVDEWFRTEVGVAQGESDTCFSADRLPLMDRDIQSGLRVLGSLRGRLIPHIRRALDQDLESIGSARWNVRVVLDELARAQWWTLTRMGASPLAEVPDRVVTRLDTAMALAVQQMVGLPREARDRMNRIEGEEWTPRKVLRRLLWLEWSLGGAALHALEGHRPAGVE